LESEACCAQGATDVPPGVVLFVAVRDDFQPSLVSVVSGSLVLLVGLLLSSVLRGVSALAARTLGVSSACQQGDGQRCYKESHFLIPFLRFYALSSKNSKSGPIFVACADRAFPHPASRRYSATIRAFLGVIRAIRSPELVQIVAVGIVEQFA
jgi:hypothetical protein